MTKKRVRTEGEKCFPGHAFPLFAPKFEPIHLQAEHCAQGCQKPHLPCTWDLESQNHRKGTRQRWTQDGAVLVVCLYTGCRYHSNSAQVMCVYVYRKSIYVHLCVCIFPYICVDVYMEYTCTYMCKYTSYTHIYVCVDICGYEYVCLYTHVHSINTLLYTLHIMAGSDRKEKQIKEGRKK